MHREWTNYLGSPLVPSPECNLVALQATLLNKAHSPGSVWVSATHGIVPAQHQAAQRSHAGQRLTDILLHQRGHVISHLVRPEVGRRRAATPQHIMSVPADQTPEGCRCPLPGALQALLPRRFARSHHQAGYTVADWCALSFIPRWSHFALWLSFCQAGHTSTVTPPRRVFHLCGTPAAQLKAGELGAGRGVWQIFNRQLSMAEASRELGSRGIQPVAGPPDSLLASSKHGLAVCTHWTPALVGSASRSPG